MRPPTWIPLALGATVGAVAWAMPPAPCVSASCGAGLECLASRCVPAGGEPVPAGARRVVVPAQAVAVIGAEEGPGAPVATLGAERSGARALLVRFDVPGDPAGVVVAFLHLTPSPLSEGDQDVPLAVTAVLDAWAPDEAGGRGRPRLRSGGGHAQGIARGRPRLPVRIDVTSLVKQGAPQGFAVTADARRGRGVALGTGGADAPRLDLYVR